jgi:hypothetical protein
MTSGAGQRDHRLGMFQLCYTWVPPDVLKVSVERLTRLVVKLCKIHDWNDKNFYANFVSDDDVLLP